MARVHSRDFRGRSVTRTTSTLALTIAGTISCGLGNLERGDGSPPSRQAATPKVAVAYPCEWTSAERPEELSRLGCPKDHASLAGEPVAAALPANQGTMFLVERELGNKIHFVDSRRWRHFSFASERLAGYAEMTAFNAEMYYRPERRLFLGTITRYLGPDIYALEIAPIDKASPELIQEMFGLVQSSLGWPADLRYHPTSNALEMAERLPQDVPIVSTEELYQGASYQGMNLGRTIGKIHLTSIAELGQTYVARTDIVVIDHVPNDLPAVAGLVTAEFQTPLSHVNLLSQNRGTPNMASLGATTDPRFLELDGRWIELQVRADGFTVEPSSAAAAEEFWQTQRPAQSQVPALDLSVDELMDAEQVDLSWVNRIGGKAANFGELTRIKPALPLPTGFVVPCAQYVRFMQSNGLFDVVESLLADPVLAEDAVARRTALADLRTKMLNASVDPELLTAIEQRAAARFGAVPTRLRSSSNAEDLAEFNGAGLYESETWDPSNSKKSLPLALKRVWASLWGYAAFEERNWARVDHRQTAMGVLIHPAFPDEIEAANGVAITANPFDPPPNGQAAFCVNVQAGASSVVSPDAGVVPESFLYYKPPAGQGEMTYFSHSSLSDGQPILAFAEIVALVTSLKSIDEHFARLYRDVPQFGMDVEFKFLLPERKLIIKQARRYSF